MCKHCKQGARRKTATTKLAALCGTSPATSTCSTRDLQADGICRNLGEPLQGFPSPTSTHRAPCHAPVRATHADIWQTVITITLCIPAACYKTIRMVLKCVCNLIFILFAFFHPNASSSARLGAVCPWVQGQVSAWAPLPILPLPSEKAKLR